MYTYMSVMYYVLCRHLLDRLDYFEPEAPKEDREEEREEAMVTAEQRLRFR